ncbi:hypothetical protein Pelo_4389 [Pelomyxa schiedti]|nr:hypothetical protein Pelo_4389 [Pelomyxa schiedti]
MGNVVSNSPDSHHDADTNDDQLLLLAKIELEKKVAHLRVDRYSSLRRKYLAMLLVKSPTSQTRRALQDPANHHCGQRKHRSLPIIKAAVRGSNKADKVRALALDTPLGEEPSAAWIMGVTGNQELSVVHVCASLGHLEEMNAVLEAWAERAAAAKPSCGTPNVDVGDDDPQSDGGNVGTVICKRGEITAGNYGVEGVRWLVDGVSGKHSMTGLMMAVREGHGNVVECLVKKWKAGVMHCCDAMGKHMGYSALHMCVEVEDTVSTETILSACSESQREALLVLGAEGALGTSLDLACRSQKLEFVRLLANPRWGAGAIEAMDQTYPINTQCNAPLEIFEHLCSVFSNGLEDAFVAGYKERQQVILKHPGFPAVINCLTLNEPHTTALFTAVVSGEQEMVSSLLSLGASPNVVCEKLENSPGIDQLKHNLKFEIDISSIPLTAMVFALITDQKSLVQEMAEHGGSLPPEFCEKWSQGDPLFSLQTYLDGSWEEHLQANKKYSRSLPFPEEHWELYSSMRISDSILFNAADISVDDPSITSMIGQYNTEIRGVLELLDVQSLGRIQQTSRIWYNVGRSNALWQCALLNTCEKWKAGARAKLHTMHGPLSEDSKVKWKHVCFFWLSRCLCRRCHCYYRICDDTHCAAASIDNPLSTTPPSGHHQPRAMHAQLLRFAALYNTL